MGGSGSRPGTLFDPPYKPFDPVSALKPSRPKPKPSKPRPKPRPRPNPTPSRNGSGGPSRPSSHAGHSHSSSGVSGGASKPSRPRTFTDGNGVVRRVRTVNRKSAPPKKDPLEEMVDRIIASQVKPLEDLRTRNEAQSRGQLDQNDRLSEAYDQRVGQIRSTANIDLAASLAKAAELKGISAETVAKNQAWLMSLMGPDGGGGGRAAASADTQDTAAMVGAANDSIARDVAGSGQRLSDVLGAAQAGGRGMQREFAEQERRRLVDANREVDSQIAGVRGKRAETLYQMQAAEREAALKEAVAQQEWGLKTAQFDADNAYRQGQLGLASDRNRIAAFNAANGGGGKAVDPGRYGNIPKRYDKAIQDVWDRLNRDDDPETVDVDESAIASPWRTAWSLLSDRAGLNPTTAALLASKWYPVSVSQGATNPFNLRKLLANRGVSVAAQKSIIDRGFGPGTYQRLVKNPSSIVVDTAKDAFF